MVVDFDIENFLNRLFDRLDARIAKFDDFARIGHDDMVVVFIEIRFLVMRLVVPKLVLAHERAIEQQFNGVVQSGAAHAVVLVFHFEVEVFYVKMFFTVVNFLKNRVAFRRFAMAFVFQVHRKNALYDLLVFAVIYRYKCHAAKVSLLVEVAKLQSYTAIKF